MEFLLWWNLVFELPFLASALYIVLQATGLVGDHDHDADHDLDHDIALVAPVDHDLDHDMDHDFGHGIEHTTGHELTHGEAHAEGGLVRALEFLGVGKVPLSIVLMLLFGIFGATGFISNLVLGSWGFPPAIFFWISLVLGWLASLTLTRSVGLKLARIMPKYESYSIQSIKDLLGEEGEASVKIDESFGLVNVRDQYGIIHQVRCLTEPDRDSIPQGSRVMLVGFADDKEEVFLVKPSL